ncbi:MAG: hypothetical protein M3063_01050 [Actinomycetota bacterium]|nr:hypothetical protein [Actinomycetota bacterium]
MAEAVIPPTRAANCNNELISSARLPVRELAAAPEEGPRRDPRLAPLPSWVRRASAPRPVRGREEIIVDHAAPHLTVEAATC